MDRVQWHLTIVFVVFICFGIVRAERDSDSDSNESGSGRKKVIKNATPSMNIAQPYGYPYNHPVYMPQGPPTPCGVYNPSLLPYYCGYNPQPQQIVPLQPNYDVYHYGGYKQPPARVGGAYAQWQQYLSGIPVGSSTINHSLKVNKPYKEDGYHYKTDSSSTD